MTTMPKDPKTADAYRSAVQWLARLQNNHLIGKSFTPSADGAAFPVINPATMEPVGQAAAGQAVDVDLAVAAAKQAQPDWALSSRTRSASQPL